MGKCTVDGKSDVVLQLDKSDGIEETPDEEADLLAGESH